MNMPRKAMCMPAMSVLMMSVRANRRDEHADEQTAAHTGEHAGLIVHMTMQRMLNMLMMNMLMVMWI